MYIVTPAHPVLGLHFEKSLEAHPEPDTLKLATGAPVTFIVIY